MTAHTGSCLCGQVTLTVRGAPLRVGICHCTDCRQDSGSAFSFYGIWPAAQFEHAGETIEARGARHHCARCGSPVFSLNQREAELKLGLLPTAPTAFTPTYELWVKRRERWLQPIPGAEQHDEDRP